MTLLKILVACHKPAVLPPEGFYIPIHAGRKGAENKLSADDWHWMLQNTRGDDTGDNISGLNPHLAEMSAVYWAWKNYSDIGNPEYIGLCHYRRYFKIPENFLNILPQYDIIAHTESSTPTNYGQYSKFHNIEYFNLALNLLQNKFPGYSLSAQKYLQTSKGYFCNMAIMKKELFFNYCHFIFELLLELEKHIDYDKLSAYDQRLPALIAERLTGIFIFHHLGQGAKLLKLPIRLLEQTDPIPRLQPAFSRNNIPVVFSVDNKYVPYLSVALQSVIQNSQPHNNYDIIVLEAGISAADKHRLLTQINGKTNFSLRFANISTLSSELDNGKLYPGTHFTIATYYRFFIPQILKKYDKILYLDCDLIVLGDIAELYHTKLENNLLGATFDIEMHRMLNSQSGNLSTYLLKDLRLKSNDAYFQAGVLLFNIKQMLKEKTTERLLAFLQKVPMPLFADQDILNAVCQGRIKYFSNRWNFDWHIEFQTDNIAYHLHNNVYQNYLQAAKNPQIIHYAGNIKPWQRPELPLAQYFWKFALNTPFYGVILQQAWQKDIAVLLEQTNRQRLQKYHYWKYKIFSKITWGKKRKKYKKKYQEIKKQIKASRKK